MARDPGIFGNDPGRVFAAELVVAAGLPQAVYGPDVDGAAIDDATDAPAAACQIEVAKAVTKCQDAKLGEFLKCKKGALEEGKEPFPSGARSDAELETCIFSDPKGKIAKACDLGQAGDRAVDGIRKALERKCAGPGVDLSGAFPHCAAADVDSVHDCLDRRIECLACHAIDTADGLQADCDRLDEGVANGSCADRCGDGLIEYPGGCDDGNTASSDGCSASCRVEFACTCVGEPSTCTCPCAHSPCQAGAPLVASCGSCATTICASDPFCCSSSWDSTCAAAAMSACTECAGG